MKLRNLTKHNETYIFIAIIVISLLIQARSWQFYTPNNLVRLASASVVPGLMAIGAFAVIISGGIDVSFPALASLSVYITTSVLLDMGYTGGMFAPIVMTCVIGAALGAINGFLIAMFKLPPLIVTLGTASMFRGFMQGALNSKQLAVIPEGMSSFGNQALFVVRDAVTGQTARMPTTFIVLVVVLIIAFLILRYTMFGRGLYAIGGNELSARRAGFNVGLIKFFLYVGVGVTASLAGLMRVCMMTQMHPTNMLGMEMMVIAGVVLGGTAITGGSGSLTGCMLGTFLIVMVQNSLIIMGIPTFWQGVTLGILILIGTGVSAYQVVRTNDPARIKAGRARREK